MRSLTATAIRATPAGPDRVALIVSTDEDGHTELLELLVGRQAMLTTMRDILDVALQTWFIDPKDPTDA